MRQKAEVGAVRHAQPFCVFKQSAVGRRSANNAARDRRCCIGGVRLPDCAKIFVASGDIRDFVHACEINAMLFEYLQDI